MRARPAMNPGRAAKPASRAAIAALAAALFASPALPADQDPRAGSWQRIFPLDVERALGRSISVDVASVVPGGLGRTFREAELLLRDHGGYPRGTAFYHQRSVDCAGGRVATARTLAVAADGRALGAFAGEGTVGRVHWDSQDGKVLGFVCRGILPR